MADAGKPTRFAAPRVADCVDIVRVRDASHTGMETDRVIVEEPLTIMLDRVGSFTVLCTPSDIEALAVGFVYSEGMIRGIEDVTAIFAKDTLPNVIGIEIREPAQSGIARNLVVASSCGLCGVRNIEKMLSGIPACPHSLEVPEQLILEVAEKLRPLQTTFALTGSSHAAALFDRDGNILAFAEDIGRHNALDKAIGKCLLAKRPPRGCGVVLSGRVSLEMVTKAARAGLELVVAVSGVSSYAITAAKQWNITLCGFVRNGRINIYTDPTRIRLTHRKKRGHSTFSPQACPLAPEQKVECPLFPTENNGRHAHAGQESGKKSDEPVGFRGGGRAGGRPRLQLRSNREVPQGREGRGAGQHSPQL